MNIVFHNDPGAYVGLRYLWDTNAGVPCETCKPLRAEVVSRWGKPVAEQVAANVVAELPAFGSGEPKPEGAAEFERMQRQIAACEECNGTGEQGAFVWVRPMTVPQSAKITSALLDEYVKKNGGRRPGVLPAELEPEKTLRELEWCATRSRNLLLKVGDAATAKWLGGVLAREVLEGEIVNVDAVFDKVRRTLLEVSAPFVDFVHDRAQQEKLAAYRRRQRESVNLP